MKLDADLKIYFLSNNNTIKNVHLVPVFFFTESCIAPGTSSTWTFLCHSSWELFQSSSKMVCCTLRRTASTASSTLWVPQTQLHACACSSPVNDSDLLVSLLSMKLECRAVMVFFHYCVLSNYFWLFIEGLYLFTLLVETFFPEKRYFYWYIIIGWGETLTSSHMLHFSSHQTMLFIFLSFCEFFSNRNPHLVCDHLGSAEATLWWYRVCWEPMSWLCMWSPSDLLLNGLFFCSPAVGTWMTMLPSGGWSRDLCWPQLWCDDIPFELTLTILPLSEVEDVLRSFFLE